MAKPWTEAEITRIKRYLDNHRSAAYIAKRLGRTERATAAKIQRLRMCTEVSQPWTAQDYKDLQEMLDEGLKQSVIAKRLGRSEGSVSTKIMNLGLRSGGAKARRARARHARLVGLWQSLVTGRSMEAA